jgi:molybdopterin converting factor subunit 1
MKLRIRTFGIVTEIAGSRVIEVESNNETVGDLRRFLCQKFPALIDLNSLFIAVNRDYAADSVLLKETDEIALIPPVSGG